MGADERAATVESVGAGDAFTETEEVMGCFIQVAVLCAEPKREETEETRPRSNVGHGHPGLDDCLECTEERPIPYTIAEEFSLEFDHDIA